MVGFSWIWKFIVFFAYADFTIIRLKPGWFHIPTPHVLKHHITATLTCEKNRSNADLYKDLAISNVVAAHGVCSPYIRGWIVRGTITWFSILVHIYCKVTANPKGTYKAYAGDCWNRLLAFCMSQASHRGGILICFAHARYSITGQTLALGF